MNLLEQGLESQTLVKTELTRKLTIDGITRIYPVYKIRLDNLFFNDKNDRIATWISQYKTENNIDIMDMTDMEKYNEIIHNYIYQSNPEAIKKTQENIELVDQREPGVVLADGRIIDGNRRFTCLRNLSKDNPKFNYFEAVILDRDLKNSEKQIKMLELNIQHGEETKIGYNPIDKLVGIYNDVIDKKLLTPKEYAQSTNSTENEINKQVQLATLMVEFLDFINAQNQFYIARDMDLNGPLVELQNILKKAKDTETEEDLKSIVFTNLLVQPGTDMTRFIRKINPIAKSAFLDEFVEEQLNIAEEVLDKLETVDQVTMRNINKIFIDDVETKYKLERSLEKADGKVKSTETLNRPLQILEKVTDSLEAIDVNLFVKLDDLALDNISSQISTIEDLLDTIKESIDV